MSLLLKNKLWVEKYRPVKIDSYIFQNSKHQKILETTLLENLPGHVLLSGPAGTGKTSLSNLIISELNVDPSDVLRINASDENSVDVIRNKISDFISVVATGDYRVVQLEECDFISASGQAALKFILEEYVEYAKFILTCNDVTKIVQPLKSRMNVHLDFKAPDKQNITKRIIEILLSENIKFEPELLLKYVDICYPDLRKLIQMIQQHCVDGVLLPPVSVSGNDDYKFKIISLLETDQWSEIRNIICTHVSDQEMSDMYRFLYENLDKTPKFQNQDNWDNGQVLIAEYLYRDFSVSDKEINLIALIIQLGQI